MIIGTVILLIAIIRGDIHSSKELTANAIAGFVIGISPIFLLDMMNGVTELFKMLASITAFLVAAISFYRAWKFKDKKTDEQSK